MRLIILLAILVVATVCSADTERFRRAILGKCIQDKECKPTQYCDHHWPNPVGSCKEGFKNGAICALDRHCSSKVCHSLKCAARRAVRNGPCQKSNHAECIPEQYCDNKKCVDRKLSGFCRHSYQCVSNKCDFLRCHKTMQVGK